MNASLLLLGCLIVTGQAAPRASSPGSTSMASRGGEWLLMPRLTRGQELVYRGQYAEETQGGPVQLHRAYRLEARIFVLDTPSHGAELALLTILTHRDPNAQRPTISAQQPPSSVRLERLKVDLQGQVTPTEQAMRISVPLEGPPSLESGMFVAVPNGRLGLDQSWDLAEEGRPAWLWRAVQRETVAGNSCIKLIGVQQSEDWDRPRGDRTAWRRTDTVWMSTNLGYACRVERRIERRDPAHLSPTQGSILRYELESGLQYPGPTFEVRRQDINQALQLRQLFQPLRQQPSRYTAQLAALSRRITGYLEHHPETPYREAILQLQRQVEAAERGETPPLLPENEAAAAGSIATLGETAPDFMTTEFGTQAPAHLRRGKGAPLLLIFFNPSSSLAADVLRFGQHIQSRYGKQMTVLGMCMGDDGRKVSQQRSSLQLTFPMLSGTNLRTSYDVQETPKIMLLDANQIVRGSYVGWGSETAEEVQAELKRWLRRTVVPGGPATRP